jgi:dTDP-4-dehydrorhamnose reductase
MIRILILGCNGMLGKEFFRLSHEFDYETYFTSKSGRDPNNNECIKFNCELDDVKSLLEEVRPDFVINCIGYVKQRIVPNDFESFMHAVLTNSIFPKNLAYYAKTGNFRIIQIATDCVFDGSSGNYFEDSIHNAGDIYGITKSLGEINCDNFMNLRVSIIGKATESQYSLVNWLLEQNYGETIMGYTNYYWNGITSLAFAKICFGIISHNSFQDGLFHVVPSDRLSKHDLVSILIQKNNRDDLILKSFEQETKKDLTLKTLYPDRNRDFWKNAGYNLIPSITDLVREMR